VCFRFVDDGFYVLRGATYVKQSCDSRVENIIESSDEYALTLRDAFDLQFDTHELDILWSKAWSSHLAWLESQHRSEK
jgi:hypothetical protein